MTDLGGLGGRHVAAAHGAQRPHADLAEVAVHQTRLQKRARANQLEEPEGGHVERDESGVTW